MNVNIENVVSMMVRNGEVSQEELDQAIAKYKETSPINNINDLGEAVVVTFVNDNQLGDLVTSLFMQVNDMAGMVMQLQTEVDNLKNGGSA